MKTHRPEDETLIAVPYYGTLSLPPSGLARIFFLVKVDLIQKAIASLTLQVWNPKKEPNLFRWLRQVEADGVICGDSPLKYEVGLHAEGLWVKWGEKGEVHEIIERWMRTVSEKTSKNFSYKDSGDAEAPLSLKPVWEMG